MSAVLRQSYAPFEFGWLGLRLHCAVVFVVHLLFVQFVKGGLEALLHGYILHLPLPTNVILYLLFIY